MIIQRKRYGEGSPAMPELTVLLTVKDRPAFTDRWLSYANAVSMPFPIYVADGGSSDDVQRLLDRERYSNICIDYLRFTPDENYQSYYAKVRTALEAIPSEFCLMADDDDFYSVSGVEGCVNFLKNAPVWSACQGLTFHFNVSSDQSLVYAKSVLFGKTLRPFYDLAHEHADQRISALANRNVRVWYSVQRTRDATEAWRFIESAGIEDLFLAEMAFSFAIVVRGKVKNLRVPYYFRQNVTVNSSNETLQAHRGGLIERSRSARFNSDLKKISDWLTKTFCPQHMAPPVFQTIVDRSVSQYMETVPSGSMSSASLIPGFKDLLKRTFIENRALSSVANFVVPCFDLPFSVRPAYQRDRRLVSSIITRREKRG